MEDIKDKLREGKIKIINNDEKSLVKSKKM